MIPPRKHSPQEDGSVDSWLMSYADMITLLMCFFIIFVSVSEPKNDKFSRITQGLANKFGSVDLSTPFMGVFQSLQAIVENHKVFKDVAIERSDRGVSMELSSSSFFKGKTAEFDESRMQVLSEMAEAFKKIDYMDYRMDIEGFTNDLPADGSTYPSNWELTSARSARMVRFFVDHGIDPQRLTAVGYGDTHPKVPNLDEHGNPIPENREKNQRMVIKLERPL